MRKLLYTFAALASMLAMAASCQRETPLGSSPDGDLIDVSMNFTVDDGRPATKAIGDGLTANKLTFLAYDEKGNYLSALLPTNSGYENLSSRTGTVNLKVVKGMKYKFVFIASSEAAQTNSYFTLSDDKKTLTIDYTAIATAQNEDSDFFYHLENDFAFSASGEAKGVTLKRPLAQLNVGSTAEDFTVASNSGIDTDALKTGYKLTSIPNKLNLLDGTVSGEADITLGTATRPSETLTVSSTNYAWVSMAYVLVGTGSQNTDVTLNVDMTNTGGEALSSIERAITAVPLKRNYRTNILGNIFSIDAMFNVSVDQNFETTDGGNINVDYIAVNSVADLNTTLTTNKANTQSQTYVVTTAEATTSTTTDIVIPDNTKAASLVFQLNEIATGVNSIVIRDEHVSGGEEIQYGKEITLEVPVGFDIDNITVNAPYSHVVVKQGDITTLVASTGGDTIVIADGTTVETLTVKCGNVRIEKGGKVTSIKQGEGNEDVTYVYLEDLSGWGNINSERSEKLIPVIDDIKIPLDAVVVPYPYDSSKTADENAALNGTTFFNTVKDVADGKIIYVQAGKYQLPGNDPRFTDHKSFTMIGVGGMAEMLSNGYGFSMNCTQAATVNIKNFIISNGAKKPNPIYVKDYITLYLENVILHNNSGDYAIVLDSGNQVNGAWHDDNAPKVYAKGVTIDAGKKVGLMGIPRANVSAPEDYVSYAYFYYDETCVNIDGNVEPQAGAYSTGSNLFVNGEPLPPYTTDGQLAIKDDDGNWKIVAGYKYKSSLGEIGNGAALIEAIRATKDSDEPFYIGEGIYVMDGDNCRVSGAASGGNGNFDIRGYGNVIIKGGSLYGLNFNAPEPFVVKAKLSDVTVEGGKRCPIFCRGNVTLDLSNVTLKKGDTYTGDNAINIDAGSDKKNGQTITVNCKGVQIEEGMKAEFIACPFSTEGYGDVTSYINFNYDSACNFPADVYRVDARNTGNGNIKVNDVAVN